MFSGSMDLIMTTFLVYLVSNIFYINICDILHSDL